MGEKSALNRLFEQPGSDTELITPELCLRMHQCNSTQMAKNTGKHKNPPFIGS